MKRVIVLAGAIMLTFLASSALADVHVNIGVPAPVLVAPPPPPVVVAPPPPTMVVQPIPPPPGAIVVVPPLPPGVVIAPGPADYWFWDGNVNMWFYFDVKRHRHYDRHHVFADDGRHYYVSGKRWKVGHEDMGKHKGWYKDHGKYKEKYKHKGKHGYGRDDD